MSEKRKRRPVKISESDGNRVREALFAAVKVLMENRASGLEADFGEVTLGGELKGSAKATITVTYCGKAARKAKK